VAESRYWAGLAFRSQGSMDDALRQFDLIIQNFPGSSVWGPAWLERGKTYALAKDFNAAANAYLEFAIKYPTRNEAPEALWRAGVAARSSGDLESAQSTWITLTDTFPASDWTAAALMWQGKLALAQGQDITASTFFSRAAAFDPTSYYSVRAEEWRRGDAAPLQPVSATLKLDEPAERAEAEAWLAARLSISDTTQLRGPRADVAAVPALQRGRELVKLNLLAEADYEFDAVRTTFQGDALALYQLALLFHDIGMYRQSIAAADAVIRLMQTNITAAPPFLARLVYPTYFGDLVVPEAQARRLDPLLEFSVIRQESLFESLSFSTAAAHGLMQIIPATGQEIANALGWPNYSRTDLYKPYVSIKFGTYYLARQRDGLDGDLYAALAAYNGGPGNAARWKAASGGDPDLFYETVSFSETRLYLRRIAEYYEVYKKLYRVQ
jgi:soluble lytic murein transglycosylase